MEKNEAQPIPLTKEIKKLTRPKTLKLLKEQEKTFVTLYRPRFPR